MRRRAGSRTRAPAKDRTALFAGVAAVVLMLGVILWAPGLRTVRGSYVVARAVGIGGSSRDHLVGRQVDIGSRTWVEWGVVREWEDLGDGKVRVGSGFRAYSWEGVRLRVSDGNGVMWLAPR